MSENLIEVKNLCKYFPAGKKRTLKAVDNVSLTIAKGETLGLVGESGCGKTTCGRTILKLYPQTSGQIFFDGQEVSNIKGKALLNFKKRAQMIFQDPYSSLDPRMTIAEIISEGMTVHNHLSNQEKQEKVNEPEFIVCDEPISALDVSIQAQIINLLIKLQKENHLTYLFISHDLSVVRHISDRVGIMYLGSMVELGSSQAIFGQPLHPYTKALISAIPEADPDSEKTRKRIPLEGEVPSPIDPPSGCKFRPRCAYATDKCAQEIPTWEEAAPGHFVACHHWRQV